MPRRSYSEEDKAGALAALAANGGNVKQTSGQLGIPRKTLEHWANGEGVNGAVAELGHEKRADLAAKLEDVAHRLADAMPAKIQAAGLQQVAVSLGISVEKARLLKGEPTSISGVPFPLDLEKLTDEQLAQLDAIFAAAGLPAAG